jgi:hypothetical protein
VFLKAHSVANSLLVWKSVTTKGISFLKLLGTGDSKEDFASKKEQGNEGERR